MYYIKQLESLSRVTLSAPLSLSDREILTPDAIEFLTRLQTAFGDRRRKLLARRSAVQHEIDMGVLPDFPEATRAIREGLWRVKTPPADLVDRRVEITTPASTARLVINALNSGANVAMVDFEDSLSPSWTSLLAGQRNVRDAVRGTLTCLGPEGRRYELGRTRATLMARPRGWHLVEKHFCLDGEPVSASLFDFGLCVFHNARRLVDSGTGAYFYLPKIENRFEAALWNEVFLFAEEYLRLPASSVRATVLIESILASFEMDEILYELRDRSAGLNLGRADYVFSFIKKFRKHPMFVLPDRARITMESPFLEACSTLLVRTAHRRGAHAIGGVTVEIPGAAGASEAGLGQVRADKRREALAGYDGTWVPHPRLVQVALEEFRSILSSVNQLGEVRPDAAVTRSDLMRIPEGPVSGAGVRENIQAGVRYFESWLSGTGAIRLNDRLEDAATAEVSRAQVWQWLRHAVRMDTGTVLTPPVFRKLFAEEMDSIHASVGAERYRRGQFEVASRLFFNLVHEPEFTPFFTLKAYQYL